jgi:peptidoglycan LD-endopeptidase LytH
MKSQLETVLGNNQPSFHNVVDYVAGRDIIATINLSKSNTELTEEIYSDTLRFSNFIDEQRKKTGAKFLVGGYAELRDMYKRSLLFDIEKKMGIEKTTTEEPRRLHIGMDLWGETNSPVHAPLGGMVHSFAFNNNFGDYGATIILQHQLNTVNFYTLYGHLSFADIKDLRKGKFITRGETFAHFGSASENGNWPPHLHFQIIYDIRNYEGDYPGVCKLSEKEKYLPNCPDPNLILQFIL